LGPVAFDGEVVVVPLVAGSCSFPVCAIAETANETEAAALIANNISLISVPPVEVEESLRASDFSARTKALSV
jgi:hypothetical protein